MTPDIGGRRFAIPPTGLALAGNFGVRKDPSTRCPSHAPSNRTYKPIDAGFKVGH